MFDASLRQKTGWTIGTTVAALLLAVCSARTNASDPVAAAPKGDIRHHRTKTTIEATSIKVHRDTVATIDEGKLPGSIAGALVPPPGEVVYNNEAVSAVSIYLPNPDFATRCAASPVQFMADDLTLASGPCSLTGYSLLVAGLGECGSATFDVHVELWNGNPCDDVCATLIPGTATDFTGIPNDGLAQLITTTLDAPVDVPGTVWMRAQFSINDAGWMLAFDTDGPGNPDYPPDLPDIGSTEDFWAEDDTNDGCDLFVFQSGNYASFWATLWCDSGASPTGACCDGTTCSVLSESDCGVLGGTWPGSFTDCELNVCQPGACCSGNGFQACRDGTEATCADGIFHPNMTCAQGPCAPHFLDYSNEVFTAQFFVSRPDAWLPGDAPTEFIAADDIEFGTGNPCQLGGYEMVVFGDCNAIDGLEFDARLALWTNDDNGTPENLTDDRPLAEIPGTEKTFSGIPADRVGHTLTVVPNTPMIVDSRIWVAVETTPDIGGPGLAGFPNPGQSFDQFAENGDPNTPGSWTIGQFFGGHTPELCPGPNCVAAGSFRIQAWCAGEAPTGACCNRAAGTCTDGVAEVNCDGRWAIGETCDNPGAFSPVCGAHACCFELEQTGSVICANFTQEACNTNSGALAQGVFCEDVDFPGCPGIDCLNKQGDCFGDHLSAGCDDAFCCAAVCRANPINAFCCEFEWDSSCVIAAESICPRDNCVQATVIEGPGLFDFDTTTATMDGPAHDACNSQGGGTEIDKDTWFAWTSTCDGTAFVRTCTHTTVDTMIAVYAGTTCAVSDANLLDCDDSKCIPQSLATFQASSGEGYLIRVGSRVGAAAGTGQIEITCGPPNHSACPGNGDCCAGNEGVPGCTDEACCEAVCACDSFCCDVEWDADCSAQGLSDLECGAAFLCQGTCGPTCPTGGVSFTSPSSGAVDARMPHEPGDASTTLGVSTIVVIAPAGARTECWTLCETGTPAVPNEIVSVSEVAGEYTIQLAHPIAAGDATTITYTDDLLAATTGTFIHHPANTNADAIADANDVLALIDDLAGNDQLPYGELSRDADHSGGATAADVLRVLDLLNGADQFAIWNETTRPSADGDCP